MRLPSATILFDDPWDNFYKKISAPLAQEDSDIEIRVTRFNNEELVFKYRRFTPSPIDRSRLDEFGRNALVRWKIIKANRPIMLLNFPPIVMYIPQVICRLDAH